MSQWVSRFASHPLWTSVQELRTKLGEHASIEDPSDRDASDYASMATMMAGARRRSTPAIMVTPQMLDTSDAAVRRVIDDLAREDEPDFRMTAIGPSVDAMVASFAAWPPPSPEELTTAVSEQLEQLASRSDELIGELVTKRDELSRRTAELETLQADLSGKLEATRAENDELTSGFTTLSKGTIDKEMAAWRESRELQEESAQATLDRLRESKLKAEEIVHSTTGVATATDFGKYARQQGIVAAVYDFFAGLVGIAGVAALIVHLYQVGEVGSDLSLSLTRLAASLGTLGIAGIIGARGGQHHAEARAAKRTDLTLRRIEPFTANLDADTKQAIIEETTARIFIRGELNQTEEDHQSIVVRLRERARDLGGRRKPASEDE